MNNNYPKVETLYLEIPFFEHIDGDMELMNEIYENYVNKGANIERIKKFIIIDYLTQLDNDELAKMFINFKSRKTVEQEEERKRQKEIEESMKCDISDDDMPF